MREILFRGKSTHDGKWVYGFLIRFKDLITEICYEHDGRSNHRKCVIPETVGQYIGTMDKNGEKIFEGDIVDILAENEEVGVVCWDEAGFIVKADGFVLDFQNHLSGSDVSVVGNIYDNPELLETEDEEGEDEDDE